LTDNTFACSKLLAFSAIAKPEVNIKRAKNRIDIFFIIQILCKINLLLYYTNVGTLGKEFIEKEK